MVLNARSHDPERKRRVRIIEINQDSVLIDGNHPQAGKAIDLALNLISIDSTSETNRRKPQIDTGGES